MPQMPQYLYLAFALAAVMLLTRWWLTGVVLEMPCWWLYLLHLPLAVIIWATESWAAARWISATGNLFLIFCAFEAARACGWWIIPKRERRWALVWAAGVGIVLGAFAARMVKVPKDQAPEHFITSLFGEAVSIGILGAAWIYLRVKMHRGANNSRHAWHAALLLAYCAVCAQNFFTGVPSDHPWFWPQVYLTMTVKVGMFITWWFKVTPVTHPRAVAV